MITELGNRGSVHVFFYVQPKHAWTQAELYAITLFTSTKCLSGQGIAHLHHSCTCAFFILNSSGEYRQNVKCPPKPACYNYTYYMSHGCFHATSQPAGFLSRQYYSILLPTQLVKILHDIALHRTACTTRITYTIQHAAYSMQQGVSQCIHTRSISNQASNTQGEKHFICTHCH